MDTEKSESEKKTTVNNVESKSKLLSFMKKNFVSVILLLGIIIVYIWFSIKMNNTTTRFETEKEQIINKFETERDSIRIKQLEFASTVFSWSVRSELLRNNKENLNQLLTVFVQESGVDLVQIVNPKDNVVMLSSDKKFEGNQYNQKLDFEISNTVVLKDSGNVRVVTPIMGFNSKIGVLVVGLNTAK